MGRPGRKDQDEYTANRKRRGDKLDVTLKRKPKGSKAERNLGFGYDQGQGQISVNVDGKPLQIAINESNKTVSVGTVVCPESDTDCIVQAIKGVFPDLSPEDVAATVQSTGEHLGAMKDGRRIAETMGALAGALRTPSVGDL